VGIRLARKPGYFPRLLLSVGKSSPAAASMGLVTAFLARKEVSETFVTTLRKLRRVMGGGSFRRCCSVWLCSFLGFMSRAFLLILRPSCEMVGRIAPVEIAAYRLPLHGDHVRDLRYRVLTSSCRRDRSKRPSATSACGNQDRSSMEAFGLLMHGFAVLLTWKTPSPDDGSGLVPRHFSSACLPGLGGPKRRSESCCR